MTWDVDSVATELLACEAERRDRVKFTDEWPELDLATGYRATPGCSKVVLGAFANGTQPTELCGDRPHAVSSLPHYLQKAVYAPKRGEPAESVKVDDAPKPEKGVKPPPMPRAPDDVGPPG